ncbi:MAG: hypothetical protein KKB70_05655 [Proteobacteria bacterium]|nr:hypothetical protein [Pseudomonadota bacterium]
MKERPTMKEIRVLREQYTTIRELNSRLMRERDGYRKRNGDLEKAIATAAKKILDMERAARDNKDRIEKDMLIQHGQEMQLRWMGAWEMDHCEKRQPVYNVEASLHVEGSSYRTYIVRTTDYAVAKLAQQALKAILPGCEVTVKRKEDIFNDHDNTWIRV